MAVGDPHQAIYGWRGASAGNLGGFAAAFSPGEPVRAVLAADQLAQQRACAGRRERRAGAAGGLGLRARAGAARAPGCARRRGRARLRRRPRRRGRPGRGVVRARARRARARRAGPTTGAILFRSKKHMVRFGDALGRRGIPHRILGLGGLLSTPEVVDVVCALRVISDPSAGSALIRLLAGPRWAIGLPDLRELAALARRIARHDAALQPLAPEVVERIRGSAGDDDGSLVDALDFVLRHKPDHGWLERIHPRGARAAARGGIRLRGAAPGGRHADPRPRAADRARAAARRRARRQRVARARRGSHRRSCARSSTSCTPSSPPTSPDRLSSLLAWLDHAEQLDEFAPRTEPPEDDVVQLLTIHGSKGLEWDAVAVVRLVKDELPSMPRDTKGWLGFGVLPYAFRGDARWLPALRWERDVAPTQQDLKAAIDAFVAANRARQLEEDRRLAYVAVTRARDHLLLTGSSWSGTKRPRDRSVFLDRDRRRARRRAAPTTIPATTPTSASGACCSGRSIRSAPAARPCERAAAAVDAALAAPPRASPIAMSRCCSPSATSAGDRTAAAAPTRIAASRYKEFVVGLRRHRRRASPGRCPSGRSGRRASGTLFHAWVEQRSGQVGIGGRSTTRCGSSTTTRPATDGLGRGRRGARDAAGELRRLGVGDLQPDRGRDRDRLHR